MTSTSSFLPERERVRLPRERTLRGRRDVQTAALGVVFVTAAAVVGTAIERTDHSLRVPWPPLYAHWMPHVGPGTPAALAVAAVVVIYGPPLAARLPWRRLVLSGWLAAMAWTWSLALIDGWHRGVARRLTTEYEYLQVIDRFQDIGPALRTFTQYILIGPDHWPAHVAGHPPAAVLTFVGLDRIGLDGGAWAGTWCITVGSSAAAAVLVTLRALGSERFARRAAPFLVLAPAAVWVGASADGYFAAVAAWGVALLALAATRTVRAPGAAAVASGLLLGLTVYLSYGLTLMAIPAVAVLIFTRTVRPLPYVLGGAAVVAGVFTLSGFFWWEAYDLLVDRYYQGAGAIRPYSYWFFGNIACNVITAGLATVAGVRRALCHAPGAVRRARNGEGRADRDTAGADVADGETARAGMTRKDVAGEDVAGEDTAERGAGAETGAGAGKGADALVVLVLAALLAALVADLSGMSKAETERIWLPFTTWLLPAAALLPPAHHRTWLAAQAAVALLVNHLLFTGW